MRVSTIAVGLAATLAVGMAAPPSAGAQGVNAARDSIARRVDQIFTRVLAPDAPGCAVGVGRAGRPILTRGYGLANLEYGVPITDTTVFESGSVAKQFTAGAIVLLALDGKLSLEEDVRKYLPELPAFGGRRITIRHLLTHTSGLRDQWGLLGLEGRGPGRQVHSLQTIVDLVARQKALNFPPGDERLYSNTGYTLLAVIVERVSGKSLDAFTRERMFEPLGMTRTRWRSDFTDVVPGRATAYAGRGAGPFRTDMPFTNVTGNGGLLSTVGDWLRWNENFVTPVVGGRAWVDAMLTRGRLANGVELPYALGLGLGEHRGHALVGHEGATAGYATWLARYPEQHLSVAVMCNFSGADPAGLGWQVAELFLPPSPAGASPEAAGPPRQGTTLTGAQIARWTGVYAGVKTAERLHLFAVDGALARGRIGRRLDTAAAAGRGGTPVAALTPTHAVTSGAELLLDATRPAGERLVRVVRGGDTIAFREVGPADTSATALRAYVGTYASEELDVKLAVRLDRTRLTVVRRPGEAFPLLPLYRDGFTVEALTMSGDVGVIRFTRDAGGRVEGFGFFTSRVRDVRFRKLSSDPTL